MEKQKREAEGGDSRLKRGMSSMDIDEHEDWNMFTISLFFIFNLALSSYVHMSDVENFVQHVQDG